MISSLTFTSATESAKTSAVSQQRRTKGRSQLLLGHCGGGRTRSSRRTRKNPPRLGFLHLNHQTSSTKPSWDERHEFIHHQWHNRDRLTFDCDACSAVASRERVRLQELVAKTTPNTNFGRHSLESFVDPEQKSQIQTLCFLHNRLVVSLFFLEETSLCGTG
jgi:hypothetical protein